MEKKNIDWGSIGFGYVQTDYRYVANFKNGAWDEGGLTTDANITMNESACVLQYAQTVFEGMKAYTTADGRTVCFRPDLNADRMIESCRRMKMPEFPKERFLDDLHSHYSEMTMKTTISRGVEAARSTQRKTPMVGSKGKLAAQYVAAAAELLEKLEEQP